MRTRTFSLLPLLMLCACALVLAGCSSGSSHTAAPGAAAAAQTVAPEQLDLVALIRSEAKHRYPDFDTFRPDALKNVEGYLEFLAGPAPLPPLSAESDPAVRELYIDAATLYELREIVAAQALVSRVAEPSPTGAKLRALIEMAYDPVSGEDIEGDTTGEVSRDLTALAAKTQQALRALSTSGLGGAALALAKLDARAKIYAEGNDVATATAATALAQVDGDGRIRAAVEQALGNAAP